MPFINGQVSFAQVHGVRICYIPGYFGYGKTLLSFGIFQSYFGPRGYKLITNVACQWAEDLSKVNLDENGKLKAYIVIDEGGEWLEKGGHIKDILRNPRKMDYVLVIPSYHPPHRSAQKLTITPVWSFRSAGIPYIRYKWSSKINANKGEFGWFGFQETFGVYSSSDPAHSPAKIVSWLSAQNSLYRQRFGYDDEDKILDGDAMGEGAKTKKNAKRASETGSKNSFSEMGREQQDDLADVGDGILDAVEEAESRFEALAKRAAKRRK